MTTTVGDEMSRVAEVVAVVPGRILQATFAVVGRLRRAPKPLHPAGDLRTATIERRGLPDAARVGVEWIDEPGTTQALVRLSRATGLPAIMPDIRGMAIRVTNASDEPGDLLLASTGLGRLTRFVLIPSYSSAECSFSTLLPCRTSTGPLLIAARPDPTRIDRFELACARTGGPWHAFGTMQLDQAGPRATGDTMSFDPIQHPLHGLEHYPWARQLREGAYRAARRSRDAQA